MPAADFLRVVDSITPHVDTHKVFIIFTGGEALLRDDLEEVGLELYRREYPWGLVTNGFLLDEKRLESLLASGMHSITVSLDGFEEHHNWIRRHPQSFEKAEAAIKLLARQKDLLWDVVTCVNPRSYPHLREFRDYLVSLGVPAWRLFSIFPMGRAAHDPELQLSDEQFRGILDFIEGERSKVKGERLINVSYACEGFLGPYEQRVRDHFFYCRSGVEVASIRCDGAISGCTSVRSHMDQGNIYKDDFWDIWQNKFQIMRDRSWAKKDQCKDCKVWRYCEGSGLHLYDDDGNLLVCHYHRLGHPQ
jgi:radical SAM enzyme (rSAM/lipoprotein system)